MSRSRADDGVFQQSLAWLVLFLVMLSSVGCFPARLPTQADPLQDMEVARGQYTMPQDEALRQGLPLGVFTGIEVGDSRRTLQEQLEAPQGVLVTRIVENSPAAAADIRIADILLEASIDSNEALPLVWPSDWYGIEQRATPDSVIHVLGDRAGRDYEATLRPVKRIAPPARLSGERFREEDRVGVIVRNASEVEAHRAGLARGEGCVVVGLARTSPWRKAGLRFEDVILSINGRPIKNPQELLATIGVLERGKEVQVTVFRDDQRVTLNTGVSRRTREVTGISIPLIYSYENERGIEKTSVLLGLFKKRKTAVAARYTLFWLIHTTVGDANRLEAIE